MHRRGTTGARSPASTSKRSAVPATASAMSFPAIWVSATP